MARRLCLQNGLMHEINVQGVAKTAEGPFARPRGGQWHGTQGFEQVWDAALKCKLIRELDGTLTTETSLMNSSRHGLDDTPNTFKEEHPCVRKVTWLKHELSIRSIASQTSLRWCGVPPINERGQRVTRPDSNTHSPSDNAHFKLKSETRYGAPSLHNPWSSKTPLKSAFSLLVIDLVGHSTAS
jgi:hypothetical protein